MEKPNLDPQAAAKRAAQRRPNATSEASAKRRHKEWSTADTAALLALHSAGARSIDIARKLGRTVFAVRTRAHVLWRDAVRAVAASGSQQGGAA